MTVYRLVTGLTKLERIREEAGDIRNAIDGRLLSCDALRFWVESVRSRLAQISPHTRGRAEVTAAVEVIAHEIEAIPIPPSPVIPIRRGRDLLLQRQCLRAFQRAWAPDIA